MHLQQALYATTLPPFPATCTRMHTHAHAFVLSPSEHQPQLRSHCIVLCSFRQRLVSLHTAKMLQMLAVDEAHCISQWGHDFRPAYRQLAQLRGQLEGLPCMALTATATQQVRARTPHVSQCRVACVCVSLGNKQVLFNRAPVEMAGVLPNHHIHIMRRLCGCGCVWVSHDVLCPWWSCASFAFAAKLSQLHQGQRTSILLHVQNVHTRG